MAIGAGSIIDSFLIALGVRVDPSGFRQVKQKVEEAKDSLLSIGTALKTFAAGFAIKEIADIGSTFEKNTTAIAAMLATLGKSADFNAGLADAEKTMNRITADAAALPGEAEDYIEVFRAGLPALVDAMPGASADEIAAFTNRLTALGTSILQVDAPQLGRDIQLMLGTIGRAGGQVRTFAQLLGYMKKLPGQANLTAEAFNRMSQPERLRLIQDTFGNPAMTAALEHSANSFDAMWGAAVSGLRKFTREASKPIFAGMKKGLDELRKLFIKDDGEFTDLGKNVVDGISTVSGWIIQITEAIGGLITMILKSPVALKAMKVALFALAVSAAPIVAPFLLILLALEDLYTYLTGGKSVIGILEKKFPAAFRMAKAAIVFLIDAIQSLLPELPTLIDFTKGLCRDMLATAEAVEKVVEAIERAIKATQEFLGLNNPHETDRFAALADSAGTFDRRLGANDNAGEPTFLRRPASMTDNASEPTFLQRVATMTGASAGVVSNTSNSRSTVTNVHVDRPVINNTTSDPKRAGEETARSLVRAAQKAYR